MKLTITEKGKKQLESLLTEWQIVSKWALGQWDDFQYGAGITFFDKGPFTRMKLLQIFKDEEVYELEEVKQLLNDEFNGEFGASNDEIIEAINEGFIQKI